MRYAKRRDAIHAQVEEVFRRMLGDHVTDSSAWGDGAGDLFVSHGNYAAFIEIKINEKQKLRAGQIRFKNRHPNNWLRVDSVDEAVIAARLVRQLGKQAP